MDPWEGADMTLRLSVISEHGIRLGADSTKVFGVHGGSIGRGTDNEWILPDPERYLSSKHARVDFRAGSYILVDTSSNGTYVNGSPVPLGKYQDYPLQDGDYVRLGEYEFLVTIDKSNDVPPDKSAIVAYDGRAASSAVRKATANDLGEDLDVSELLEPNDPIGMDSGDPDASWHLMTRPLVAKTASTAPVAQAASVPTSASAAPRAPRAPTPTLFEDDLDGISAFCRGAGVDARAVTPETRGAVLQLAGQLLRESVLGLMDLNQSRNEFRNRFHISTPPDDRPESPLNFSGGVDEALVRLLTTLSTRAGSVEAIRDSFREFKAQNAAALSAMRSAFEEFLERVDPKQLEERFDKAAKRGVFGTQNKGKYWDLYSELFPALAHRPVDGFPHVFAEAFVKAYQEKLRKLIPPPRRAFGADRREPVKLDDRPVDDS